MSHIASRKTPRNAAVHALMVRAQAFILIGSVLSLGTLALVTTYQLNQAERQLELQARV